MKPTIALLLVLAVVSGSTACSSFSKQGRQERAYAKYIRKSSIGRQKQQRQFRSNAPQMPTTPMPSEPMESSSSGPEAIPSDG